MAEQGFENLEFYQDGLKLVKAAYPQSPIPNRRKNR